MRKLLRFRLRTLLFAVAAIAVVLAMGPWLWWRYKVNSALEAPLTKDGYAYLLSDHERVADRLMAIAQSDDDVPRRMNAIRVMRTLSARSGSFQIRKRLLPQLVDLACNTETPSELTCALAKTIDDWIPATGVTIKERAGIHEKAIAASGDERIAWIGVLNSIGGRNEILLLLHFGESHKDTQWWTVYNSQFRFVKWQGMLPHVGRWIRDPIIADYALEFSVLSDTTGGRDVLLEFIFDQTQPRPSRTKAVQQLAQTVAGIDRIAADCGDQRAADILSDLLGVDCRQYLAAERTTLSNRNGDELWRELIDGLEPTYWLPSSGTALPDETKTQIAESRKRETQLSLNCLRLLSKNPQLSTKAEWIAWRDTESPDVVMLDDLLRMILDHPEMLGNSAILRRIVPDHLGYIPDNCIPLYEQRLHSDNLAVQYGACEALLAFTDSAEAVDVAIDLIDQSKPSDAASHHPGAIAMLQRRFAVNFFWDTDAWRNWANDTQFDVGGSTIDLPQTP